MFKSSLEQLKARRAAGEKGFTLVELLVLVVTIAALAAIAVPIFLNQNEKADASVAKNDVAAISKVVTGAASVGAILTVSGGKVSFTSEETGDQTAATKGEISGLSTGRVDIDDDFCFSVDLNAAKANWTLAGGVATGACPAPVG